MDPLSVTTAIITLASAISEGLRQAQTLRDAPAEIHALANDVTDLEIILQEVVKTLQEWSRPGKGHCSPSTSENLSTVLGRARTKLLELDSILNRVLVEDPVTNRAKYARLGWLRQKSKVESIRRDLASIKLSLNNVMEAANSVTISRIHLKLNEIALFNQNISGPLSNTHKNNREELKAVERFDGEDEGHVDLAARNDHNAGEDVDGDHISADTSRDIVYISRSTDAGSQLSPSAQCDRTLGAVARADQASIIQITASRSNCPRWCSCICHKPSRLNSPRLLNEVFGAISVGYVGVPLLSSPCNEKRCKPRPSASARIMYQFPSWIMARAVSMLVSSKTAGPELQLRTLRIINPNSDIFRLAITGDVNGVKSMFKDGLASIYDIDNRRWSLLHKAFLVGQAEVCKFLLEQGADPSLEAANGSTPMERAWHFDRTKTGLSENNRIILEYMFKAIGIDELAESQQYTTIHKIVLGLSSLNLESQLQDSTSTIDDVDTRGRTALWWAAARGDYETVKILLEYGASVQDPAVPRSHSALHVAKTSEVVEQLLNHGAKVDCRDESGRTPLHCCAYRGGPRGGSVELFKALLEGGADVNAQSATGHTALHYTAMYGFTEHMPLLLARGVPIDSRKPNGTTPLLDAVGCSQPQAAKYLLGRGADPRTENTQRRNIVHIAASRSDVLTMRVLASVNLTGVDVEANDCFGMTPRQCFDVRQDKSAVLEEAFDHLLESCMTYKSSVLDIDTDDESDRFEDALESAG